MHFLHILYNNELIMVSQTFLYYACNIIFWVFSFFKFERWLTLKSQAQNIKNILSSRIEEASWKTGSRTLLWRWWAFFPPGQSLVLSLESRFLVSYSGAKKKSEKKCNLDRWYPVCIKGWKQQLGFSKTNFKKGHLNGPVCR